MFSILNAPPQHGALGSLDEILLYCLPVVIAIVVLAISARRSARNNERTRQRPSPHEQDPA